MAFARGLGGGESFRSPINATPERAAYSILDVPSAAVTQADGGYQLPSKEVVELMDAPPLPDTTVSPDGRWLLLSHTKSLQSFGEIGRGDLTLLGRAIDVRRNSYAKSTRFVAVTGFTLIAVADGRVRDVESPPSAMSQPLWSPNSEYFAFLHTVANGVELWVAGVKDGKSRLLVGPRLNPLTIATGTSLPCRWLPDGRRLLCHLVPERRAPIPVHFGTRVPEVQETGQVALHRSRPVAGIDLLTDAYEDAAFEYYFGSQPVIVDVITGDRESFGEPAVYQWLEPAPDGRYFFTVRVAGPIRPQTPTSLLPHRFEVLDSQARVVYRIPYSDADNDNAFIGKYDAVGPRNFSWDESQPATLFFTQRSGAPENRSEVWDRLFMVKAPFSGKPAELLRTRGRLNFPLPATFGCGHGLLLTSDYDPQTYRTRLWLLNTATVASPPRLLLETDADLAGGYSYVYPVLTTSAQASSRMLQRRTGSVLRDGAWIYLTGMRADSERPYLDRLNLQTGHREVVFQASGESYEEVVMVLDPKAKRILTTYETPRDPPNYVLHDLSRRTRTRLTDFSADRLPLSRIEHQFIRYQRADGLNLKGRLLLPRGYRSGQTLPTVLTGYPVELARGGKVRESPYRFAAYSGGPTGAWETPHTISRVLLTQGYALFDAGMPVIGGAHADDTYVDQIVSNAKAAIDALVERGITQRSTVGVLGHSYGAFMAANLLANSDLFAVGVALNGAYNLTDEPFGFQLEERTLWEAPQVYLGASALMHADRIRAPLLLIHGDDDGWGTPASQSRQLYSALQGQRHSPARLVIMPDEGHLYVARESKLHIAWEMIHWFDRYLKPSSTGASPPSGGDQLPDDRSSGD